MEIVSSTENLRIGLRRWLVDIGSTKADALDSLLRNQSLYSSPGIKPTTSVKLYDSELDLSLSSANTLPRHFEKNFGIVVFALNVVANVIREVKKTEFIFCEYFLF